ncbi:MAG: hypothetical protein HY678_07515 [Chloroflexi bacterium]|nr:hypothetical protein [Chloroflexota bacterium]
MQLTAGDLKFEWIDDWARGVNGTARAGWAHPGMATSTAGEIITFHAAQPKVLILTPDGQLVRQFASELTEGHGLTLIQERGRDYLWIADPGAKRDPSLKYDYPPGPRRGRIVKLDLNGKQVSAVERPEIAAYRSGTYSPTCVAVAPPSAGGDIWVADGYGQSLVHRYSSSGSYLGAIDGTEGSAGRFNTPHAVMTDGRRDEPELYIADRSNRRIQVYGLDGKYRRVVGADFLSSPSAFASWGGYLFVAELRARIAVLDRNDRLVGYLGANEAVCDRPGWPNAKGADGVSIRPPLEPGRFNSPHGITADADGNVYVAEWLIGGRYVKLART